MLSKRGGFLLSPKYSGFIAVAVDGYQKKPPNPTNLNPNSKPCECVGARKADFGEFASASHLGVRTQESRKFYFILFFFLPRMSPAPPPCSPRPAPPPRGGPAGQNGGEGRGHAWGGEGGTVPVFPVITEPGARSFAFCPRLPQIRIGLKMYFLGKIKFKNKLRAGSVGRSGTVGGSPGRTKRAAAFRTRGDRAEKKSPEIRAGNEC